MTRSRSSCHRATVRFGNGAAAERGVALLVVLAVLSVLACLVSTVVLVALSDQRTARNLVALQHAFAAADAGVHRAAESWDPVTHNRLRVGDSLAFSGVAPGGRGEYRGWVRRLGAGSFLVTAEGNTVSGAARQRLGMLMRLSPPVFAARAAFATAGPLSVDSSAVISGHDRPPPGWPCPTGTQPSLPALLLGLPDSAGRTVDGCAGPLCLTGSKPFEIDTLLNPGGLLQLGSVPFADLPLLATHRLLGGVVRPAPQDAYGMCVTAPSANWGDPYDPVGPCGDFFPLVFAQGSLTVSGGRGQGVLAVEGDLTVERGFHYHGLVVVSGRLMSGAGGGRIDGAVVAAGIGGSESRVSDATAIQYSSCAVDRALVGMGRGQRLESRSWLQAY